MFDCSLIVLIWFWWSANWITNWPTKYYNPVLIHHTYIYCSCCSVETDHRSFCLFLVAPVEYGVIKDIRSSCDWGPISNISCMAQVTIYVEQFEYCFVWLLSSLPNLRKHWRGISLFLKILFLEYTIGSCV